MSTKSHDKSEEDDEQQKMSKALMGPAVGKDA
jgi:hypothetical protein